MDANDIQLTTPMIIAADKLVRAERLGSSKTFLPIAEVTRPTVDTEEAANALNRRPQTLRIWAMQGSGPITPLRINGRLAWPTAALKTLLGV